MNELAKVDSFRFLQWAAEDKSDYEELFYNLGLCKIGTFTAAGTDIWKCNDIHFLVTTKRQDFIPNLREETFWELEEEYI